MLTYFPTPYPGEWWYSVLCRYHVRSGNSKHQSTIKELIPGRITAAIGSVYPNSTIRQILSGLPDGLLSVKDVIIKSTLFPYYSRFSSFEKKTAMLEQLCRGETIVITSIRKFTAKRVPRYCPQCVAEDRNSYGEAYWHIEHQIPLMPLCPKHGCRLRLVEVPLSRLSEVFLPLSTIGMADKSETGSETWEPLLTAALNSILSLPFETGPPLGYSNLENVLLSAGFGIHAIRGHVSLDAEKLKESCINFYGKSIGEQYFAKLSPAIIYRVCHWKLTSPERYALLTVFAGLTIESLLGLEIPVVDPLLKKLLEYKKKGIAYRKEELAQLVGVSPHQLGSLAKKYNVAPFWKQCGGKRTETIRITLTQEEKQRIAKAAAIHGNGQTAMFAREVLLREVNQILKKDGGIIK